MAQNTSTVLDAHTSHHQGYVLRQCFHKYVQECLGGAKIIGGYLIESALFFVGLLGENRERVFMQHIVIDELG